MSHAPFDPTRWSLVERAGGEGEVAQLALSELCAGYYEPVVSFLRREGREEDAAREDAHAFFARLLAGGLGRPEAGRGRFRSYLLGALKHFLASQRVAARAQKRGGNLEHVAYEEDGHWTSLPQDRRVTWDDSRVFDRDWALALIGRALAALEAEYAGRRELFVALKPWLDRGEGKPQAEIARTLGMQENALKVALFRLRAGLREKIRAEVRATVSDPAELEDELRHLVAVASWEGR